MKQKPLGWFALLLIVAASMPEYVFGLYLPQIVAASHHLPWLLSVVMLGVVGGYLLPIYWLVYYERRVGYTQAMNECGGA